MEVITEKTTTQDGREQWSVWGRVEGKFQLFFGSWSDQMEAHIFEQGLKARGRFEATLAADRFREEMADLNCERGRPIVVLLTDDEMAMAQETAQRHGTDDVDVWALDILYAEFVKEPTDEQD